VALLALGGAAGGTFAKLPNPGGAADTGSPQAPAILAAQGGHESPQAAVKGFIGDSLQSKWAGMCSYEIPSEQSGCNSTMPSEQTGYMAVGNAITEGGQALVPTSGTVCKYNACTTIEGNGIPAGTPFQAAYLQATNRTSQLANFVACKEVDGKWYVDVPSSPGF
jgi:hypothetical protein